MSENKRALAHIETIKSVEAIPGADFIVRVSVLGWELVAKKDEFKVGDKCVYIEIDSKVPDNEPCFEFLRPRGFKVKTIKLRKQVSQGLALPLEAFGLDPTLAIGTDVTDQLGITKIPEKEDGGSFEMVKPPKSRFFKFMMKHFAWYRRRYERKMKKIQKLCEFPEFIAKTDEPRIQNKIRFFEDYKDVEFVVTEKLEGMSGTFAIKDHEYYVCSRNKNLPAPYFNAKNNEYWKIFDDFGIKALLDEIIFDYGAKEVIVQGEIIGPKIMKNIYKLEKRDFRVFNIIVDGKRLRTIEASDYIAGYYEHDMYEHNVTTYAALEEQSGSEIIGFVPILATNFKLPATIQDMLAYADGQSVVYPTKREGCVIRSQHEKDGDVSFKAVSNAYLLEKNKREEKEEKEEVKQEVK